MSDGFALLRAIEEAPEDDTPRLAYADWLDEGGDGPVRRLSAAARLARAEFIRAQCELAALSARRGFSEVLIERQHSLREAYNDDWMSLSPVKLLTDYLCAQRGFISRVGLNAPSFVRHGETLAATMPLHHLRLEQVRAGSATLAGCPTLAHVRILDVSGHKLRNAGMMNLARCPHFTHLHTLDLSGNQLGIAAAEALAGSCMPRLIALTLSDNPIKDRGLIALVRSPLMRGLTALHLAGCELTHRSVTALVQSPAAARLTELDLSCNRGLGPQGIAALASATFTGLRSLSLTHCTEPRVLMDDGITALVQSPVVANLRRLAVIGWLGDAGARAILDSPYLTNLEELQVFSRGLSDDVIQALRAHRQAVG
jgi:uncharacterized protein (TIGR02996 family)